ncbi:MAG: hypothetical protein NC337_06875 [Roseburia sp.]|nr:hypothetical protein [Roseburia sp.]
MNDDNYQRGGGRMFFFVWHGRFLKLHGKGGAVGNSESLRFSPCRRERISSCLPASMTVEAAFVLPLFLFAFLNLISILELYRLQSNMSAAMHAAAKEMAVYGYEYKALSGGDAGTLESLGITYLYAANRVESALGSAYLNGSPMSGGISWTRSRVMKEEECIDLVAVYRVAPFFAAPGYDARYLYNRIRTRAWTGYDNAGAAADGMDGEELVYITPEGTVYHRSRGCTYLRLSIVAVDIASLETMRSDNGEIYYPCEGCGADCGSTVFVTSYGNRYHSTLQCGGIKRTVLEVRISEAGGRGACSRCAR